VLILEGVITLDLSLKEVANALWKKIVNGEMNIEIAVDILRDLKSLKSLTPVDQNRYIEESLKIAVVNGITVYDALFIALAKELKMVLATCDRKQAEAAFKSEVKAMLVE